MGVDGIDLGAEKLQVLVTRHVFDLSERVEMYVAVHCRHNTLLCLIMFETHRSDHME